MKPYHENLLLTLTLGLLITVLVAFQPMQCNRNNTASDIDLDSSRADPVSLRRPVSAAPDLEIIEKGNLFGIDGLAQYFGEIDSVSCTYTCPIGNFGNANFVFIDSLGTDFLEIKVLRVSDGWWWEGYKSEYAMVSPCIPTLPCEWQPYVNNVLRPNCYDPYDNLLTINGEGRYAVSVTVNSKKSFFETNYRNNTKYFGFRYAQEINSLGLLRWKATYDSTIVTPSIRNRLNHL